MQLNDYQELHEELKKHINKESLLWRKMTKEI